MFSVACCAGCCAVPKIDITLSTMHSTGGKHPQMVNDKLSIYTEDPALGATWFREMMQNQEDHPHDVNVRKTQPKTVHTCTRATALESCRPLILAPEVLHC